MELKKYKLGEILDVTRGASLSGEFYATEGKYIRLTCGNFDYQNNCFKENKSKDNIYYVGDFKPEFLMEKGDIITPLTEQAIGLLGSTAIIPESSKYIQSQDVAKIICKEDLLDKDFAFYLISSALVKQQLSAAAQQTKIRHTSPDKIKDCTVWIPELSEQKRIGKLLCSIDRKIELNRAINQNLEAMAKQLYDYWFVQFDFPDENGRPYKSSGGEMVWNEKLKREIPKGWDVKTMGNCTTILLGGTPDTNDSSLWGDGYNWLNSGEVAEFPILSSEKYITQKGLEKSSTVLAPKGSVTLSITRHLRPSILCIDACINQSVVAILENEILTNEYIYPLINREIPRLMSLRTGAQQPHINKEIVESINVVIPPQRILYAYIKKSKSLYKSIFINAQEIADLAKQRDELLPLLMNGQVSVNSDLSKCISEIGIVALIRNYPNSLLKYWRLVIIYKCRITFSYNFSSHFASLPSPSQISSTSSDRLLPPRLVGDRPSGGRKWSLRHHWRR